MRRHARIAAIRMSSKVPLFAAPAALPVRDSPVVHRNGSTQAVCVANPPRPSSLGDRLTRLSAAAALAASLALSPLPSLAVSGGNGGGNYAGADLAGADLSGQDFTGGRFRGAKLAGANLRETRFFKTELRQVDMTGSDLTGATIEGAPLQDAILTDAILTGAYISDTVLEVADITGADFSDALISPESAAARLCEREDARGVNPVTGVATRER